MHLTSTIAPTGIAIIDTQHDELCQLVKEIGNRKTYHDEEMEKLMEKLAVHFTIEEIVLKRLYWKSSLEFRRHQTYHRGIIERIVHVLEMKTSENRILEIEGILECLWRDGRIDEAYITLLSQTPETSDEIQQLIANTAQEISLLFQITKGQSLMRTYEIEDMPF